MNMIIINEAADSKGLRNKMTIKEEESIIPLADFFEEKACEEQLGDLGHGFSHMTCEEKLTEEGEGTSKTKDIESDDDDPDKTVQCITFRKRKASGKGEKLSLGRYGLWGQERKNGAARLEKHLKARWVFESLIEEQLRRYYVHYNHSIVPTKLKDVSQLFMPKWALPLELAALSWFGDWRPSAILNLVHSLVISSISSRSSSLSDSKSTERLLAQLIQEIRIEEAVIDEEMAEIQATCILYLPFSSVNSHQSSTKALRCVHAEFKKIERVISRAQQLRYKALELVVKKVLSQTEAAEFLVAFARIQDAVHQLASKQKSTKVRSSHLVGR